MNEEIHKQTGDTVSVGLCGETIWRMNVTFAGPVGSDNPEEFITIEQPDDSLWIQIGGILCVNHTRYFPS